MFFLELYRLVCNDYGVYPAGDFLFRTTLLKTEKTGAM